MQRDTTDSSGRSDVARRIEPIGDEVIERAHPGVGPGRDFHGLTFGTDDPAVIVDPVGVADKDLQRASGEDCLQR